MQIILGVSNSILTDLISIKTVVLIDSLELASNLRWSMFYGRAPVSIAAPKRLRRPWKPDFHRANPATRRVTEEVDLACSSISSMERSAVPAKSNSPSSHAIQGCVKSLIDRYKFVHNAAGSGFGMKVRLEILEERSGPHLDRDPVPRPLAATRAARRHAPLRPTTKPARAWPKLHQPTSALEAFSAPCQVAAGSDVSSQGLNVLCRRTSRPTKCLVEV